ncbi:hypothetical protein [Actinoplanes friuliensis]|uniref:hypothetical protein n=1 Tax=Actinoplanes friuliensis TaxID=196914 RepID=UPI0003FE242B|nr:hypothetical protein [Actinoplanes friuliensis]
MKHLTKLSLVVVTATATLFAGSMYAFAGWTTDAPKTVLKMRSVAMPAGNAPSVAKNGKNAAVDWVGSKIAPGVKVQSYIVTRFGVGNPVVVCDRVTTTSCKDKLVPGGTWTWKVQPVFASWIGDFSPASVALTFSGPPPAAADLVSATSPADPAAPLPASPAATPTAAATKTGGGGDETAVPPPPQAPVTSPPAASEPTPEDAPVTTPPAPATSGPVGDVPPDPPDAG